MILFLQQSLIIIIYPVDTITISDAWEFVLFILSNCFQPYTCNDYFFCPLRKPEKYVLLALITLGDSMTAEITVGIAINA